MIIKSPNKFTVLMALLLFFLSACGPEFSGLREFKPLVTPKDFNKLRTIAFNQGNYNTEIIADLLEKKLISAQFHHGFDAKIQHIWIEVYENTKESTLAQLTVFLSCQSKFVPTFTGQDILINTTCKAVLLDAFGRFAADRHYLITYKQKAGKWVAETITQPFFAPAFVASLPLFALEKLYILSGFLAKNPGTPVISYQASDKQIALSTLRMFAELAPGVAKNVFLKMIEKILKKSLFSAIFDDNSHESVRYGRSNQMEHAKVHQFASLYLQTGENNLAAD